MRKLLLLLVLPALLAAPGCGVTPADKSTREWERAECNRVIDPEAREKCLKRIE